jgi:tetratricopeptide (TPR) repeat protein
VDEGGQGGKSPPGDQPPRVAGSYREGRQRALEAHARRPADPGEIAALVAQLRRYNESAAIRECLARLPALEQLSIPQLLFFATQLGFLNQPAEALRFLDEARRGDPDYPPTLASRGQALIWLGRFDEAERELVRCIQRAPQLAQPHWSLAQLRTWSAGENHVERLRAQLARPGRSAGDVALLGYALHKELDDLGRFDEAWDALATACAAQRSRLDYDPQETRLLFDRLLALPPLPAAAAREVTTFVPTFIVGMHRSGTTLLEQLLAGHSQFRAMGELYDFTAQLRWAADHHCRGPLDAAIVERAPGFDFAAIGRGYRESVAWRVADRRYCVDKLPSNFLNLAFIFAALPHARVLHMVRDPAETCFSNLRELFSDACPYSYDQQELAGYFGLYRRLMAHWHERFPGRILDVPCESLVSDTEATLRRVAVHCGTAFEATMLDTASQTRAVATASAVRVRGAVAPRPAARWKPYAAQLQPLLQALARQEGAGGR